MPLRFLLSKVKYSDECQNCDVDLSINSATWNHMFPARRKTIKITLPAEKKTERHTEERNAQKTEMPRKRTYRKAKAQNRKNFKRKKRTEERTAYKID